MASSAAAAQQTRAQYFFESLQANYKYYQDSPFFFHEDAVEADIYRFSYESPQGKVIVEASKVYQPGFQLGYRVAFTVGSKPETVVNSAPGFKALSSAFRNEMRGWSNARQALSELTTVNA